MKAISHPVKKLWLRVLRDRTLRVRKFIAAIFLLKKYWLPLLIYRFLPTDFKEGLHMCTYLTKLLLHSGSHYIAKQSVPLVLELIHYWRHIIKESNQMTFLSSILAYNQNESLKLESNDLTLSRYWRGALILCPMWLLVTA